MTAVTVPMAEGRIDGRERGGGVGGEAVIASCAMIPNGLAWRVGVMAAGGVTGSIVSAAEAAERMRELAQFTFALKEEV